MRCAVCGNEAMIDGMCLDCYISRRKFSHLDDIMLTRCSRCGSFKLDTWRDVDFDTAIYEVVQSNLRVHPQFDVEDIKLENIGSKYVVRLRGKVKGYTVVDESVVNVKVNTKTCERCSRLSGGYYESVVQIRADGRILDRDELKVVFDTVERLLDRERNNQKAFLSKVVERKEGIDFYFGDKNLGRKVSREIAKILNGKIIESRKLHTKMDGRDLYRYTFAIRLPCYKVGDIVVDGDKLCIAVGYGRGLRVEDLGTVKLKRPKLVKRKEDLERGVVVSCDDHVAEVVSDKGTIQAVRSKGVNLGDEVYVFEYGSRYYAVKYEGC